MELTYDTSPEEDNTVSSASLCMSPTSTYERGAAPLCASTPYARLANGYDVTDDGKIGNGDAINGNVTANIVSESTHSMDVLSGGESDAGDTLTRRNNNSISSNMLGTLREGAGDIPRRRNADVTYFVAKELLMTERTYKRDLELVTVAWSWRVSELAGAAGAAGAAGGAGAAGPEAAAALARACLALGPLALPAGALLARLERMLTAPPPPPPHPPSHAPDETEEPEYKKIAEVLHDYLSTTADAYNEYISHCGALVGLVESVRRCNAAVERACASFDATAPLPLACLLLRPLHRLLHYERLAEELCKWTAGGAGEVGGAGEAALRAARGGARRARQHVPHAENHAALCQLQRDIAGYDKLLVAEREFIRLGCVYKHSTRGLQQRMLFLFNDVLILASKSGSSQFRAHAALPLHTMDIKRADLPHSFTLTGEDVNLLLNASNEQEFQGWYSALEAAISNAPPTTSDLDTELTPYEQDVEASSTGAGAAACAGAGAGAVAVSGGALAHVCWHRAMSVGRDHLHLAMRTQLSGYLLRKFKKSPGWQKLWVVFAVFTLFFYKSWQDETPLASLPLLGYGVGPPAAGDGIDKEFVFKLQFKNHVYFFRADSHFTYNRWTEVLQTATLR